MSTGVVGAAATSGPLGRGVKARTGDGGPRREAIDQLLQLLEGMASAGNLPTIVRAGKVLGGLLMYVVLLMLLMVARCARGRGGGAGSGVGGVVEQAGIRYGLEKLHGIRQAARCTDGASRVGCAGLVLGLTQLGIRERARGVSSQGLGLWNFRWQGKMLAGEGTGYTCWLLRTRRQLPVPPKLLLLVVLLPRLLRQRLHI